MSTTFSTRQWQRLQSLFEQAEQLDTAAAAAFIAAHRGEDERVADALASMLSANRQWARRTDAAVAALSLAATPSASGTRLGAFELLEEIGRGGMGVVYRGERGDGRVQQEVAIKILHTGGLDEHTRARFQREREILAGFDHPGIARLLDAGESSRGEPYYVMEYLRGLPVDAHCDRYRLSIAERLRLLRKICDAVQYAHSKLILHRDIKPSNILVDEHGVPKLIDFGIAKPLGSSDTLEVQQTIDQQRYFSLANAAPEQIRGGVVSVTCDVYQLGALLHELVCGSPLFALAGTTVSELERKILNVVPDAPSQIAESAAEAVLQARRTGSAKALAARLRGDIDVIVQRAVRKEPEQRYASVEQLAQDIDHHLQDRPIRGRQGDRRYRFARFVRRNRRAIAATGAIVAAVIAFAITLLHQVNQTAAERDRAVNASRSAEAVTEFLLTVFRSGDPAVAKKADLPIGQALAHAQKTLDTKLADEPAIRARISGALATIYNSLGEFRTAAQLSTQSLALLETTPGIEPEALLAELRQNIDILLSDSQFDKLQPQLDKLQALEAKLRPGQPLHWRTRLLAATVHWQTDIKEACRQAETLVDETLASAEADPEAFVRTLLYTSRTCRVGGEAGSARTLERVVQATDLVRRRMDADEVILLDLRLAQATSLRRLRRNDEAIPMIEEVARESARIYGENSLSEANALLIAGGAYNTTYNFAAALKVLQRAEAIYAHIHRDAPNGDIAVVAFQLGTAYDYGKIDAEAALKWYAKAYEVGQIAFGVESGNVGAFAADYGTLLRRRGDFTAAEPVLRKAARITPLDSPIGNGFMSRLNLGIVLAQRGQWDEVRTLVAECEKADAEFREDPEFKADWEALRTALAQQNRKETTRSAAPRNPPGGGAQKN
ncbi:MAG: serine/threonine protein kinase [Rhodanobacteraceae bacterium]|nr:serine/threonine protein kinase [Rhodanobacteraceae bacterium]